MLVHSSLSEAHSRLSGQPEHPHLLEAPAVTNPMPSHPSRERVDATIWPSCVRRSWCYDRCWGFVMRIPYHTLACVSWEKQDGASHLWLGTYQLQRLLKIIWTGNAKLSHAVQCQELHRSRSASLNFQWCQPMQTMNPKYRLQWNPICNRPQFYSLAPTLTQTVHCPWCIQLQWTDWEGWRVKVLTCRKPQGGAMKDVWIRIHVRYRKLNSLELTGRSSISNQHSDRDCKWTRKVECIRHGPYNN